MFYIFFIIFTASKLRIAFFHNVMVWKFRSSIIIIVFMAIFCSNGKRGLRGNIHPNLCPSVRYEKIAAVFWHIRGSVEECGGGYQPCWTLIWTLYTKIFQLIRIIKGESRISSSGGFKKDKLATLPYQTRCVYYLEIL